MFSHTRVLSLIFIAFLTVSCVSVSALGPDWERYTQRATAQYVSSGWTAKTLPEVSDALAAGQVSSVALTRDYLARIERIDSDGPRLQSVLALNPDALAQAKASDTRRKRGETLGPLDGVPIMLKDNIESKDPLATTAGSAALRKNITGRDSPLVAGLRAQGAVILGKTNLSQWANFRSNQSVSGWSALGGQVRNPHMLDRSPCGSSSGSGAAVAASLVAGAVGTETNGSIICPSNVNGIVGFKPTVGLVSQQYIVPISATQDTAGPMTKSVRGSAMMLDAMDDADVDYAAQLSLNALAGKRVGVMRFADGSNPDVIRLFNEALADLEKSGAALVEITEFEPGTEDFWAKALSVLEYEFKDGLNRYLANAATTVTTRSLDDVINFNRTDPLEQAIFDQDLFEESNAKGDISDAEYLSAKADVKRATGADGIDKLMRDNNVDLLVSPSGPVASRIDPVNGDVWPAWAGAGYLAAVAGYPHITVPMGDVHGVPVGLSLMAGNGADAQVLSYGYAYEQASQKRVEPQYLRSAEDRPEIAAAMLR